MESRLIRAESGFSLIELVIVVTLISILAVTVALGTGRGVPAGAPDRAGQALAAAVAQARDAALLGRQGTGLRRTREGWQVVRRSDGQEAAGPEAPGWERAGPSGRLQAAEWRIDGVPLPPLLGDGLGGEAGDGAVPVRFLPDGRGTAFEVRFGPGTARMLCRTDGWEALTCRPDAG